MGEPSGTAAVIAVESISRAGTIYVEARQKAVGVFDERGGKSNSPSTVCGGPELTVFGKAC